LPGFITIDVRDRPARSGRNPQTGEPLEVPAGRTVRLRPGSGLKDAVK
jgi:nucleoid DNA-binding protein